MKLIILIVTASSVFWGCGNKLSVNGTWKNGRNQLQLSAYNNFTLSNGDSIKLSGIYAIVFDKIEFINSGKDLAIQCIKPGRYSFTLLNDTLQFIMQDDPCTERKFMLNKQQWERSH